MTRFAIPPKIDLLKVRLIMIAEALPDNPQDYFYAAGDSLYVSNTLAAFRQADIQVDSISDILRRGVYLTVAVKVPRSGKALPAAVIREHSYSLETELKLFPNLRAILLMGDTAIKALNTIAQRVFKSRAIPTGATYKIRPGEYYFNNIRVFPSYLHTGRNFLIEKSKRQMVAEDIQHAFQVLDDPHSTTDRPLAE